MKKRIFITIAGIQVVCFMYYAVIAMYVFINAISMGIHRSPAYILFSIIPLMLIVFPITCIYIYEKIFPDTGFSKTLDLIYRLSSALYFIVTIGMVIFAFICLGDIFTAVSYPDYPTTLHKTILFDVLGIAFTISMLYLMASAIRLKKEIKKNAAIRQYEEINALGAVQAGREY